MSPVTPPPPVSWAAMMEADTRTEINPADYFSPDAPVPDLGMYRKLWYPVVMSGVGVGIVALSNIYTRRPTWSGGSWGPGTAVLFTLFTLLHLVTYRHS